MLGVLLILNTLMEDFEPQNSPHIWPLNCSINFQICFFFVNYKNCQFSSSIYKNFVIFAQPIEQIEPLVVKITDKSFSWIPEVQNCLKMIKTEDNKKLLLYSEMEKYNGILGLVMCLIKEAGIAKIRYDFQNLQF